MVETFPDGIDRRFLGTAPEPLVRASIIRPAGFIKSARPSRHASLLTVWSLADRAAAPAWLFHNPEIEPEEGDGDAGAPWPAPPTPPTSAPAMSQALLF
jgi:hypothetical protein